MDVSSRQNDRRSRMNLFCRIKERMKDRRYGSRTLKRYCVEVSCHYYFENGRVDVGRLLQKQDAHSGCLRTEHLLVGPGRGRVTVGCG